MAIITQDMAAREIAEIIFFKFEINQSCKVEGFIQRGEDMVPKGQLVLLEIDVLDTHHNKDAKNRRSRKKLPNTIGDFVAQKTFKYQKTILDNVMRYTIWRIQ